MRAVAQPCLPKPGRPALETREGLKVVGIKPCVPSFQNRKDTIPYGTTTYRSRNKIATMLGPLKNRRRVVTRLGRCPVVAKPAMAFAAPEFSGFVSQA